MTSKKASGKRRRAPAVRGVMVRISKTDSIRADRIESVKDNDDGSAVAVGFTGRVYAVDADRADELHEALGDIAQDAADALASGGGGGGSSSASGGQ